MTKRQMKLCFPPELVTEPVVYSLGQEFSLAASVRRADIADGRGWVVLELEGSDENLDRGLEWVTARGIEVEPFDTEAS